MEILLFQVIIAVIIIVAGSAGEGARNKTTLVTCIFTFFGIFTTWLLILQFITIAIAYVISSSLHEQANNHSDTSKDPNQDNNFNFRSCFLIIIIAIGIFWTISYFSQTEDVKHQIKVIKTEPIEKPIENVESRNYIEYENKTIREDGTVEPTKSETEDIEPARVDYRYDDEHEDPLNERLYEEYQEE